MAKQTINIGSVANDGTGDPLRTAFDKVNQNFTELYNDDAGDVDSVNGQTGVVVLDTDDIAEGATNKYDQTVVLNEGANVTVTGTYPNFTIAADGGAAPVSSVDAGTGISVNSTTGDVVVTNSAPDQTVVLNNGTGISTSGTYPNFTITNTEPNATHTGDVTGATALTISDDVISYAKMGAEFTTSAALGTVVDFSSAQVFTKTLSVDTTLTFSNAQIGMVKDLVITGDRTLTLPAGSTVAGTYDGTVSNLIQVVVTGSGEYWYSISQPQ
jgi:hypothetical protein